MIHVRIAPGCRRLTEAYVHVREMAGRFEGLPDGVSKGQVLSAFKQAACTLGISPRLRDAIDVLFAFSQPQDWQEGTRPIVWPSNRTLERALSLGRRQVQNVLNALMSARLITPVDSPTGRRWGQRDAKSGRIIEAYGFDLSPLGLRYGEFVAVAQRSAEEERERAGLRRRLTITRKAIQQIAETALEYGISGRDWQQWTTEAVALAYTVADETVISALIHVVTELEDQRRDGEAALTQALVVKRPCGESEEISPSGEKIAPLIHLQLIPQLMNQLQVELTREDGVAAGVIRLPPQIRTSISAQSKSSLPLRQGSSSTSHRN